MRFLSAWPAAHLELSVPISNAGIISMIIAVGTIISSLQSDRLTKTRHCEDYGIQCIDDGVGAFRVFHKQIVFSAVHFCCSLRVRRRKR